MGFYILSFGDGSDYKMLGMVKEIVFVMLLSLCLPERHECWRSPVGSGHPAIPTTARNFNALHCTGSMGPADGFKLLAIRLRILFCQSKEKLALDTTRRREFRFLRGNQLCGS